MYFGRIQNRSNHPLTSGLNVTCTGRGLFLIAALLVCALPAFGVTAYSDSAVFVLDLADPPSVPLNLWPLALVVPATGLAFLLRRRRPRAAVLLLTAAALLLCRAAVASEPVSNVTVSLRSGAERGMVDVYYDLAHPEGGLSTVSLSLSKDGGATFPLFCTSVTGDVGPDVASGTRRHIVWHAMADYPGEAILAAAVRVMAEMPLLVAAFEASVLAGTAPLTVEFEDLSVAGDGPIDSWNWDFGDGTSSAEQYPTHTYDTVGTYAVTLTVGSGTLQSQVVKDEFIIVGTDIADAFGQFADPNLSAQETAEALSAAMDVTFLTGGLESLQQEMDAAFYEFLDNGGDPALLIQRSQESVLPAPPMDQDKPLKYSNPEQGTWDRLIPDTKTCTNVVIHVNGINTNGPDGKKGYFNLLSLLRGVMNQKDAEVEYIYNPSASEWFGGILDLGWECTIQAILDRLSLYGVEIQSQDWLVQKLAGRIQWHVAKGRNVIVVPHSQGNFYTQEALWILNDNQRQNVHVVEAASPVVAEPPVDAFRVDIQGDFVAQLSPRYASPPLPYEGVWGISTWLANYGLSSDVLTMLRNHNFEGAYLMGQASETIVSKVREFCVLPAPVITAFAIDNKSGATASRIVTLNNACTYTPHEYKASESSTFSDGSWLPYSPAPSFHITSAGGGVKTIYLKVRNRDGRESRIISNQILLNETAAPSILAVSPNPVPGTGTVQTISLTGTGFQQGCSARLRDKTNALGPWTKSTAFISGGNITFSANVGSAASTWSVQVINPDGTKSAESNFGVTAANQAVSVYAFVINAGAGDTTSRTVTLTNVAANTPTDYIASESSGFVGAIWRPYSAAPSFTLSAGNGLKTVYFKVKNASGESNVVSDSIMFRGSNGSILIATIEDLQRIGNDPAYPLTGSYELMQDIDASQTATWNGGKGFAPIGRNVYPPFSGRFEGNGHTIRDLTINRPDEQYVGLFARVFSGTLQDIGLENASVAGLRYVGGLVAETDTYAHVIGCHVGGTVTAQQCVGGVAGTNGGAMSGCYSTATVTGTAGWAYGSYTGGLVGCNNQAVISRCWSSGPVKSVGSYDRSGNSLGFVGGLVGYAWYYASIQDSYSTGSVTGENFCEVGGLIGYNSVRTGTVARCYSTGAVTGATGGSVGGFVGNNHSGGLMIDCYARGAVTGTNCFDVAGFVGNNNGSDIARCYAAGCTTATNSRDVGGFAARNYGSVQGTFWDTESTQQFSSAGDSTGKTTAEMKARSTYVDAGWDFSITWGSIDNISYPYLLFNPELP